MPICDVASISPEADPTGLRGRYRHSASAARWAGAPGAVATVIDSQSVKAADTVGKDSRSYD